VDVFQCCLFTWEAVSTVLPAFALAGAVTAFIPPALVLRYLGAGAKKTVSYSTAAISGIILSLCSCNVVPLFVSIYRTGAGIGPASTFLYAGPAINLVSLVLVFEAIGWQIGLWRAVLVPVVGIATGLSMALIFGRADRKRQAETPAPKTGMAETAGLREWALFGLLTGMVVFGAIEMPLAWKLGGLVAIIGSVALLATRAFSRDDLRRWWEETWHLFKIVIPVLIPAVVVIGLVASWVDIKWIYRHVGDNSLSSLLFADLFGELMYFPVLAEVVFAKAMMKLGLATGPAMAILLTGTGASLPGAIIIGRCVGWAKASVFIGLEIVFTTLAAWLFASEIGAYICQCMMNL
jgi:uncharacterized membrane protein YraQ (UPF0718 family)